MESFPENKKVYATGICIGASTVSLAVLRYCPERGDHRPEIHLTKTLPHEGHPNRVLLEALSLLAPEHKAKIALTVPEVRPFCEFDNHTRARKRGGGVQVRQARGAWTCPAVVSAGGETFMVYVMDEAGNIADVVTGNKCASGTGEFFLQQLRRMNVTIEEASRWAASDEYHPVSGRCSVFCKSDCTHAMNKGTPKRKWRPGSAA